MCVPVQIKKVNTFYMFVITPSEEVYFLHNHYVDGLCVYVVAYSLFCVLGDYNVCKSVITHSPITSVHEFILVGVTFYVLRNHVRRDCQYKMKSCTRQRAWFHFDRGNFLRAT